MHILHKIVQDKEAEVAERKHFYPATEFEKSPYFDRTTFSMKSALQNKEQWGIIAEFKPESPSAGIINAHAEVIKTTRGYIEAGASALSVLTDASYFGGSSENLTQARRNNDCPVLRKDFIIDEYQILEAKSIGADAVLLIAAILTPHQVKELASMAKSLSMEVLLEVHSRQELEIIFKDSIGGKIDLVGINNRNLDTFEVNIENAKILGPKIPRDFVKIAESGISDSQTILELRKYGFEGFLIGAYFMKQQDPAAGCASLINALSREVLNI